MSFAAGVSRSTRAHTPHTPIHPVSPLTPTPPPIIPHSSTGLLTSAPAAAPAQQGGAFPNEAGSMRFETFFHSAFLLLLSTRPLNRTPTFNELPSLTPAGGTSFLTHDDLSICGEVIHLAAARCLGFSSPPPPLGSRILQSWV